MTTKNIRARKAGAALSNVATKAPAKGTTAKTKHPTKAELARHQADKHKALAVRNATTKELPAMLAAFVSDFGKSEATARDVAASLNIRWAADMAEHKLHWSAIYRSNNAKVEGNNLNGLWKQIDAVRAELAELVAKNPKISHASRNAPWSRIMKAAVDLSDYAGRNVPPARPTAEKAKAELVKVYKMLMREEVPSELDLAATETIGQLLRSAFKVDLSTLNV